MSRQAAGPEDSEETTFENKIILFSVFWSGSCVTHGQLCREDFYCRLPLNLMLEKTDLGERVFYVLSARSC